MIYIISKLSAKVRKIGQSTKHLPDFLPMLKSKRDKIIFLADTKSPIMKSWSSFTYYLSVHDFHPSPTLEDGDTVGVCDLPFTTIDFLATSSAT